MYMIPEGKKHMTALQRCTKHWLRTSHSHSTLKGRSLQALVKDLGIGQHASICNASIQETEAGGSPTPASLALHRKVEYDKGKGHVLKSKLINTAVAKTKNLNNKNM